MNWAGTVSLMVVRRGCDEPCHGSKFVSHLLGACGSDTTISPALSLYGVDVEDVLVIASEDGRVSNLKLFMVLILY